MGSLILRWLVRGAAVLVLAFLAVYAVDSAIFLLRGSPSSTVTINRFLAIPLKDSRTEYDYQGSSDQPCSRSLFAQGGKPACWQLQRNPNQFTKL
ncbi:hypothetical protein ACOBR2_04190 [Telmatobacter bradus]|uniref:hypothetical protein n=1 Tax=Telmatobacter bradus TaxID=474953 RepID=UPI003B43B8D9